jgi:apolipoprotein N-acyltransferase
LIKPLINYVNISNKYSKILLISALFSVSELTRYYLLNGVPWLIPGNIYLDTISQNIYPIFGVSALSIMIYILCAGYAVNLKKKAQYFLLGLVLISIFPENKTATAQDGILVSIIQPSSDPFLKYEDNYSYKIESNLDALINKTSKESQLIVIPEAELPYVLNSKRFKSFIENTQKSNKIIMGAWNYDENKLYNVIYSSKYTETYKKKHLVPFGEYIPFFERLRGIIKFFDLPMSNVSKGSNNQKNLNILNNVKVSTPICFDIAFSNTIRKMNKSSLLMINISNDTWFGNSIGPYQHLNLARIRSIENNRWTIRSTNDGISAIISNNGTIVNYLEKGVSDILEDRVSLISNRSFYNKIGYLFIYLFIIMTSLILTIKYIWKKINFS